MLNDLICIFIMYMYIYIWITPFWRGRSVYFGLSKGHCRWVKILGWLRPWLVGIENGGHYPWRWRPFWPFWLRILEYLAFPWNNLQWVWVRVTRFAPKYILGFSQLVLKMGVIDLDLLGHLAILTQNFKKRCLVLFLSTDLEWPRGVACPKHALVYLHISYFSLDGCP